MAQTQEHPHLRELEAEGITVIRELAAQFEQPCMLFSGGKDSIVMSWLAWKAFYPAPIPFPLVHIDTGHNFPETLEFRDWYINQLGVRLVVGYVQESIDSGEVQEETGPFASRNGLQTVTLLNTLKHHQFDAAAGGGRRDEEKARAKERFFSHRNLFGQWDPKNQRPELWQLFNGHKQPGEHFRVFPLSNWTERDIWLYIRQENIPLPQLYFAHEREVIEHNGVILAWTPYLNLDDSFRPNRRKVRFRTIGDMTCTGATLSEAADLDAIIHELEQTRTTERGGRADDKRSQTAMEDRKVKGYF